MTVEQLRDATIKALRKMCQADDGRDERLLDLQSEVDDLNARIVALEARLDDL